MLFLKVLCIMEAIFCFVYMTELCKVFLEFHDLYSSE